MLWWRALRVARLQLRLAKLQRRVEKYHTHLDDAHDGIAAALATLGTHLHEVRALKTRINKVREVL